MREIALDGADAKQLRLDEVAYETASTSERFLQWVTPDNRIAGFLRLSLPHALAIEKLSADETPDAACPLAPHEAMIREVHVYGQVAQLHDTSLLSVPAILRAKQATSASMLSAPWVRADTIASWAFQTQDCISRESYKATRHHDSAWLCENEIPLQYPQLTWHFM